MRTRKNLNFDLSNERHVKALALLENQPSKLQSEFVIGCILNCHLEEQISTNICNSIGALLKGAIIQTEKPPDVTNEVPDELLNALESL